MRSLTALTVLCCLSTSAFAQDSERRRARDVDTEIIREIERGLYLKSNIGSTIYLNTHGETRAGSGIALFAGVLGLGIGVGSDIIDRERFSAAVEGQFNQGLFNGPRFEELGGGANALTQGDIHTFSGTVVLEASTYLSRRFGFGGRIGGGVMVVPLLMDRAEYEERVQPLLGGLAPLHEGAKPMVVVGPTIEYYTKLSHFSVGADVDLVYVIGLDLGIYPSGFLKYTF